MVDLRGVALLLGRHVGDGAERHVRHRQAHALLLDPRDAEVGDLEHAVAVEQQVLRLHVAVDDAGGVGHLEARAQLGAGPQRLVQVDGRADEALSDGAALEVLHHHVGTLDVVDELVQAHQVRVGQASQRARLLGEARAHDAVDDGLGGHHLDGAPQVEPLVPAQVDAGHAAAAEAPGHCVAIADVVGRHLRRT
ncbi:MAG: hypothetical protein R3F59_13910 [Myxococcota bacterium]